MRLLAVLSCVAMAAAAHAATLGRDLERSLANRGTHADTAIIARFADSTEWQSLAVSDRRARDGRLVAAMRARGERRQAALAPWLAEQGASKVKSLWIIDAVAATLPAVAVRQLAAMPEVARIDLDSLVQNGRPQRTPPSRAPRRICRSEPAPRAMPEVALPEVVPTLTTGVVPAWNVAAVHAPALWELGHTGRGVVVATMDTGADLMHPALLRRWRGGDHSWFDPHGEEAAPYDAWGHGTQALGVLVGGPEMGVAPDARWIAVRLYDDDGRASMSDIHLAFQWLMDPDGDATTADAPDVVNASWALTGRVAGTCTLEFSDDVRALRAAGIAVVFAAGNDGPAAATSNSPGNNPGVLSVGAVDRDGVVARQASRGPSACDDAVFPSVVAPGVNVRTTDLSHGGLSSFTTASGSSLAAPHVSGVLALLVGAFPDASVAELEAALLRGARDLGAPGADPVYGHGIVDALASYKILRAAREFSAAQQR